MKRMIRFMSVLLSLVMILSVLVCSGTAIANAESSKATIKVFTSRTKADATNEAKDLWWFKYLEYWLNEQGYNVTLDVTQSIEPAQQISLMLGTDSLPDIVWGIPLTAAQAVMYGTEEGMILDWTPYLTEETMPNLMKMFKAEPGALNVSTCIDGKVYGLPYITSRGWGQGAGNMPPCYSTMINQKWMSQLGITELPATLDDFIDILRRFKNEIKLEDGKEVIPLLCHASGSYLESYIWGALGYYANQSIAYGASFALKVDTGSELFVPAMTEDYKTFISYMKTLYEEGLISQDYFTMDNTVATGLMADGVCGAVTNTNLARWAPETYSDWIAVPVLLTGDTPFAAGSVSVPYTDHTGNANQLWASANTEHPEILAAIIDYLYSDEGSVMYYYGPKQGEDPLGLVGGWYLDDQNQPIVKEMEDGLYNSWELYGQSELYPMEFVANKVSYTSYYKTMCGLDNTQKTEMVHDIITGDDYEILWKVDYTPDNPDGYMRHSKVKAYGNNCTQIMLSIAYMNETDTLRAAELKSVIDGYVKTESTKFIAGLRPIEEISAFQEELKKLNIEEYLNLYKAAYAPYLEGVFGE